VGAPAPPAIIGVCGAGTMGRGIAQAAALGGMGVLLHDPVPDARAAAPERIAADLARGAERGRWDAADAEAAAGRVAAAGDLAALAPCELVIEAAPEDLALKRALFAELAAVVAEDCVLATNTSSLLVTAVAAGTPRPERVVGLHFFNPAPLMRLVELVAGEESGAAALGRARAAGAAMGKRVVRAADVAGFVVNRCNRPFGLEALRLVQERRASVAQVDRICRLAGFRMGPFELMDLVGTDVGLEVARSFHAQSFGEPRWRPSPLTARLVAAGRTGRKSGRGWYDYRDGPHRPPDPGPPAAGGGDGLVVVAGASVLAHELLGLAEAAGWDASPPAAAQGETPFLILDCGPAAGDVPLQGGPQAISCADRSLAAADGGGSAVGFLAVPPLAATRVVELTRLCRSRPCDGSFYPRSLRASCARRAPDSLPAPLRHVAPRTATQPSRLRLRPCALFFRDRPRRTIATPSLQRALGCCSKAVPWCHAIRMPTLPSRSRPERGEALS